jgi:hypothetical protein
LQVDFSPAEKLAKKSQCHFSKRESVADFQRILQDKKVHQIARFELAEHCKKSDFLIPAPYHPSHHLHDAVYWRISMVALTQSLGNRVNEVFLKTSCATPHPLQHLLQLSATPVNEVSSQQKSENTLSINSFPHFSKTSILFRTRVDHAHHLV